QSHVDWSVVNISGERCEYGDHSDPERLQSLSFGLGRGVGSDWSRTLCPIKLGIPDSRPDERLAWPGHDETQHRRGFPAHGFSPCEETWAPFAALLLGSDACRHSDPHRVCRQFKFWD